MTDSKLALGLALVALVLVTAEVARQYLPYTWIQRDGRFYVNTNVTLVEDGTLEQRRFSASWYTQDLGWNRELDPAWSNVAMGREGKLYPKHPVLLPLLSTPLFWALDLPGTLIFNMLMFGIMAGAAYVFARHHAASGPAALTALALPLATGVFRHAYEYRLDVLLIAVFLAGIAALHSRRGALAGVLIGLSVALRPTSLLWVPALALVPIEEREMRVLKRALLGGAAVLFLAALLNTWMFGRPWWTGYNRTVTMVGGVAQVASHTDAFSRPLLQGLRGLWQDPVIGLQRHFAIFWIALPGLVMLFRRRPLFGCGVVATAVASVLLFAKYAYPSDRFLWPTFALLLPSIALSLEWLAGMAGRLGSRMPRLGPWAARRRHALLAATMAIAVCASGAAFKGTLDTQLGETPYVLGALALGREASLDLRAVRTTDELEARMELHGDLPVSRSRFGHWLPRASPPSVAVAAPFAAAGGLAGLFVLHLLAAALLAFAATRLLRGVVPSALAAAAGVGALLIPTVQDQVARGGPPLLGAALALLSLSLCRDRRWAAAGALSLAAAWVMDAPWLLAIPVAWAAARQGRGPLMRAGAGAAVVLLTWGLGHLVLLGSPFGSPDDFALALTATGTERVSVPGDQPAQALLWAATGADPGSARAVLPLALLAPLGWLVMARRAPLVALSLAIVPLSLALPSVGGSEAGRWPVVAVVALWLAGVPVMAALARAAVQLFVSNRRRIVWAAVALVLALAVIGLGRRTAASEEPFELATERAVREARVSLGAIPCDLLTWEHMTWECATHDPDASDRVGLMTSVDVRVGGEEEELFVIPVPSARTRRVEWSGVTAGEELELQWAVPDGRRGGASLTVEIDGRVVGSRDVPDRPSGELRRWLIDTSEHAGKEVRLAIEVAAGLRSRAAVGLAGRFR